MRINLYSSHTLTYSSAFIPFETFSTSKSLLVFFFFDMAAQELFSGNPTKGPLVERRHRTTMKTRGKTVVSYIRARARAATTDRRTALFFPIPGLTRALIRPPYTILLPPQARLFRMQNPRESKQSAGGDVCAVRFDNNPRALLRRVLPTVFSPYCPPLSLLLPLVYLCIHVYICTYRACQK